MFSIAKNQTILLILDITNDKTVNPLFLAVNLSSPENLKISAKGHRIIIFIHSLLLLLQW
jgi:hypothetical protein